MKSWVEKRVAMENKGLCSACVNDKGCTFSRKFPVLQCEEFEGFEPGATRMKKGKKKKMEFDEEPMVWE